MGRTSGVYITALLFILLVSFAVSAQAGVIYVRTDGNNSSNGLTWASAKKTVQAGVSVAASGDELWIAAGTYLGSINLKPGVSLYGGFTGNETARDQRDWKANRTVLSGGSSTIPPPQVGWPVISVGPGVTETTVIEIDGFTICNGYVGIMLSGSSPVIRNNTITRLSRGISVGSSAQPLITHNTITCNESSDYGAGISCVGPSSPTISNNIITGNISHKGGTGIYCNSSSAVIENNLIGGNTIYSGSTLPVSGGAGILCAFSSTLMIRDNVITGNHADKGGGIACYASSPVISKNIITGNATGIFGHSKYPIDGCGGGVVCTGNSSPTIISNVIAGNFSQASGAGVYCGEGSSPSLINNTVIGNDAMAEGGACCFIKCAPTVENNIVASNSSGVRSLGSTPLVRFNCVFGNSKYNYSGLSDPTGKEGNISKDPLLVRIDGGNLHIQPGSPCKDAGDDTAVQSSWIDLDGQARVQGSHVDIDADESDGTSWTSDMPVVYVNAAAPANGDGSSWAKAFRMITDAVCDAVLKGGAQIWVAGGVYDEEVVLYPFVHLYGGFSGAETSRDQRDWKKNLAIIDADSWRDRDDSSEVVVTGANFSTIDGFIIKNGGYGVLCEYASATISNNSIMANYWYGIECYYGSSIIKGNRIVGNYEGVGCHYGSPVVESNIITGNSTSGIECSAASPVIASNIIAGNDCGIECYNNSFATVTNNTITGNGEYGIRHYNGSSALSNNIVAFNGKGVYVDSPGAISLGHSCNNVYGNSKDYDGIHPGVWDISRDPLFASYHLGDLHIQPESPCRNAGIDYAPSLPSHDIDGEARVQDGSVDIGADESDGCMWDITPRIIHVNCKALPGGDGKSWTTAYKTVNAAVDDVNINGGAQIWVAEGTYADELSKATPFAAFNTSVVVPPFAHLYGGFAGNETNLDQRNWRYRKTVLDGGGKADKPDTWTTRMVVKPSNASTIDGFTVTGGLFGIHCERTSPVIRNNVFTGNKSAGIYCWTSSALVTDNIFASNLRSGVCCVSSSSAQVAGNIMSSNSKYGIEIYGSYPAVTNNTIVGNTEAGVYIEHSDSPAITGNIVAFNGVGIHNRALQWETPSSLALSYNNVYGNTTDRIKAEPGVGDISLDPLFIDIAGGDYHLHPNSPCVNMGTNDASGLPELDIDGDARIVMGAVDMGADEYVPLSVKIDVKPDEYPNTINMKSRGVVSVAILSEPGFNAVTVDPASVVFAGATVVQKGSSPKVFITDVNGDRLLDLVLQFETESLNLLPSDKEAVLTGKIKDGDYITGADAVVVR